MTGKNAVNTFSRPSPSVCIITFPIGPAGRTPLSNIVSIVSQFSYRVTVICSNSILTGVNFDKKVLTYYVTHNPSKIVPLRAINHLHTQIKILATILQTSKKCNKLLFFLGGENLLIPLVFSKIMRKEVFILFSEVGKKVSAARKDPLTKSISFVIHLNSKFADKLILYSPNMISEGNLENSKNKIVIGHEHFISFNKFSKQKQLCYRKKVVGYIGRLNAEKGILNFIRAIPLVLRENNDIEFVIYGEGDLMQTIRKIIELEGLGNHVKLMGYVSHNDISRCLNEIALLVIPSYTEGLPNIMLEAMACGTPVLASSVGAIPDVIVEGKTGFLLKINEPNFIARRIRQIISEPATLEKVGENAYDFVKSNYDFNQTVALWRDILS